MLFSNPRKILSEAATADLLDPEVSEEVKDTIEELEDVLTNNVEEIKDDDKATNGGIPVTTESVAVMEAANTYGGARYLVTLEDVIAVKEAEGEAEAVANAEPGEAPTEEEVKECEPDAVNVIEDIATKNGVEPEDVAVVITAENVRFLAETAILEAKAGKKGCAGKKAKACLETINQLKGKVNLVKA